MNLALQIKQKKKLCDFEVDKGTKVLSLQNLRFTLNYFEYATPYRIYLLLISLSLRPDEPMQIKWDNFHDNCRMLIFRPKKQNSKNSKKSVVRKVRIPPKVSEELLYYRDNNFFCKGKLFPFTSNSFRDRFNKKFRQELGGDWIAYSDNLRQGNIAQYHLYTLRSFRATCATLIFYYCRQAYGNADLSLVKTCQFMCHSHKFMTANHYIQRVEDLEIEKFPDNLTYLQLMDFVIYNDFQEKIHSYIEQTRIEKYDEELIQ
jgi:integrase